MLSKACAGFSIFLIFVFLGQCFINGFCLSSYTSAGQNLQKVAKQICDFKFKQEAVTVDFGASFTETFSFQKWEKICQNFLTKFYTSDGKVTDVITVPDTTGKKDDESWWNLPINTLKTWCGYSDNSLGLIVANYDIKEHLLFLGLTENLLRKALSIAEFPEDCDNLIVFSASKNIIFIIRVASDNLNKRITDCINDVKLLSLLVKEELNESSVVVAGLIIYQGKNNHQTKQCEYCKSFLVTPEIFDSAKTFQEFWENFETRQHFKALLTEIVRSNRHHIFHTISSKILGYMARCKTHFLPQLEDDPTKNIEQAEILLDRYQMDIVYSKQNRIILHGDYGSGKTVIALKKIQMLLETIKDKEVIYYVCFAGKSELHSFVKQKVKAFCKSKRTLNVIRDGYTLSHIILSSILPREEAKSTENVHLIVDEYAPETLTKREAYSLVDIFIEKPQFKNSTVLIAVQPIEIVRSDSFYVGNTERKLSEGGHRFDILEKVMAVHQLKYVMRTTVQINKLVQITRDYLDNQSNQYTRPGEKENMTDNKDKNKKSSKVKAMALKIHETFCNLKRNAFKSKPVPISQAAMVYLCSHLPVPIESQKIIDRDELHKLTSTGRTEDNENNHKIVTTYHYPCSSKIGHGIPVPLPKIIRLPPSISQYEEIALIGILLTKIEILEMKKMVVVHFEKSDPLWLIRLLQLPIISASLSMTDNVEMFFKNQSDSLILVKNYNFVKGMEFANVLLILDRNEYHLKQFIPEAMARCQGNLSILIKSSYHSNHEQDTVEDLVNYWTAVNSEEETTPILTSLNMLFCCKIRCSKKVHHDYCQESLANNCIVNYYVHKNSKLFEILMSDLQLTVNLNMTADDETKKEEALSL